MFLITLLLKIILSYQTYQLSYDHLLEPYGTHPHLKLLS